MRARLSDADVTITRALEQAALSWQTETSKGNDCTHECESLTGTGSCVDSLRADAKCVDSDSLGDSAFVALILAHLLSPNKEAILGSLCGCRRIPL